MAILHMKMPEAVSSKIQESDIKFGLHQIVSLDHMISLDKHDEGCILPYLGPTNWGSITLWKGMTANSSKCDCIWPDWNLYMYAGIVMFSIHNKIVKQLSTGVVRYRSIWFIIYVLNWEDLGLI